jgi:hypothetical protein
MTFLKQIASLIEKKFNQQYVVGFCASVYPLLFINKVREYVLNATAIPFVRIFLEDLEFGSFCSQVEMSFLGQKNMYWLGDISLLSLKKQRQFSSYLATYKGPHILMFFTTKNITGKSIKMLSLCDRVDVHSYKEYMSLWNEDHERVAYSIATVLKKVGVLSLEQMVQVAQYALVLGTGRSRFFENSLNSIIKPESSLFDLSGALLAGDKKSFLIQWKDMQDDYEFPFWVAYFSEQFFRSYYYIKYKQDHQHVEARKVGFRLPFSFLQRDWRRWNADIFYRAHQKVAMVDFNLKNGGDVLILESLFSSF